MNFINTVFVSRAGWFDNTPSRVFQQDPIVISDDTEETSDEERPPDSGERKVSTRYPSYAVSPYRF